MSITSQPELFLRRTGGVLLHAFLTEDDKICVSLQVSRRWLPFRDDMEKFGLVVVNAPISGVKLDEGRSPPMLSIGPSAAFVVPEADVSTVREFLSMVQIEVPV